MKCKDCPAYWEYVPVFESYPDEWGCRCQPELKEDFEHLEDENEDYYCNRTIEEINKAVKDYEEEQNKKDKERRRIDNEWL